MKKFDSHIDEKNLDDLLRQFVLEGGEDEFTQKTLTMNADFIFNSKALVSADKEYEIALIQKLEQAFIKPRGFGRFWLNGILLIALLIGCFVIYKLNSGTGSVIAQNPNEGKNDFKAVIAEADTSEEREQTTTSIPVSQISLISVVQDTVSESENKHQQQIPPSKGFSGMTDDHWPIEQDWYSSNYIVDVAGPVFAAKASPENYKLKQGNFKVEADNVMFTCKQDSFLSSYYSGEPFKSGMADLRYFNFGEYAQTAQMEQEKKEMRLQTTLFPWELPWAMLQYADTNEVAVETTTFTVKNATKSFTAVTVHKIPEKGIQLAMQPFYFRKYEVTNKEYREFANWVRASNGYANKPICSVQIDTTEDMTKGGQEIIIKGKKYRITKKSTPTEDYKDVFNYVFFNQKSDAVKSLGKVSLYVYPDTLAWVNDFTFSFNEPMTNMYFWHPAYDNYPVVGVSWHQAMAFLDWKTHMHQKQLDAENIPYEIEYTLPSDVQWELVSTSLILGNKNVAYSAYNSATQDWMTNLGVSYPGHDDPYQRPNYLKNLFTKDEYFRGNYIEDGYFHTGVADLSHEKITDRDKGTRHLDELGISWMDGNVSEWMIESYAQNWQPFFKKHLLILAADTSESTSLAIQIEKLYDKGNAKNGRLVRGANWYDERFAGKPGSDRNEAGISPKRYIDPAEKHCTVGFRYVVHVKRK